MVEASAKLNQRGNGAVNGAGSMGRLKHASDDLQQRRLTGTVGSHNAVHIATVDGDADIFKRFKLAKEQLSAYKGNQILFQAVQLLVRNIEHHVNMVDNNHGISLLSGRIRHICS